jgi:hypothetical protein
MVGEEDSSFTEARSSSKLCSETETCGEALMSSPRTLGPVSLWLSEVEVSGDGSDLEEAIVVLRDERRGSGKGALDGAISSWASSPDSSSDAPSVFSFSSFCLAS